MIGLQMPHRMRQAIHRTSVGIGVVRRAAGCVTVFIDLGYANPSRRPRLRHVVRSISEAANLIIETSHIVQGWMYQRRPSMISEVVRDRGP